MFTVRGLGLGLGLGLGRVRVKVKVRVRVDLFGSRCGGNGSIDGFELDPPASHFRPY